MDNRTLREKMDDYMAIRAEFDRRVDAGELVPRCFTCKAVATHRTKKITPGGYKAYQCAAHAIDERPQDLWGSDPGWCSTYDPLIKNDNWKVGIPA